jgi:ribosomal protein S27E
MNPSTKFVENIYSKNRSKYSRMLDIYCRKCKGRVCIYQKDGGTKKYMGQLRRLYIDRFLNSKLSKSSKNKFICRNCGEILGTTITYAKENRKAVRLYVGAVRNKIIQIKKIE